MYESSMRANQELNLNLNINHYVWYESCQVLQRRTDIVRKRTRYEQWLICNPCVKKIQGQIPEMTQVELLVMKETIRDYSLYTNPEEVY